MKRGLTTIAVLLSLFLTVPGESGFAAEGPRRALGSVVATGNAMTRTGFDKWIPIDARAYPLIDGSNLKTGQGRISITMKDGAKMEVGKEAELQIAESKGSYCVHLLKGTMAFRIPRGLSYCATTPNAAIAAQPTLGVVQRATSIDRDELSGIVNYNVNYGGRTTKVVSLEGSVLVENTSTTERKILNSVGAVYITDLERGQIRPVALSDIAKDSRADEILWEGLRSAPVVEATGAAGAAALGPGAEMTAPISQNTPSSLMTIIEKKADEEVASEYKPKP